MTPLVKAQQTFLYWNTWSPYWGVAFCTNETGYDAKCQCSKLNPPAGYYRIHTSSGMSLYNMNVTDYTGNSDIVSIEVSWYDLARKNKDHGPCFVGYGKVGSAAHTDFWNEHIVPNGAWWLDSGTPGKEFPWWLVDDCGAGHLPKFAYNKSGPVMVKLEFAVPKSEQAVKNILLSGWVMNTIWTQSLSGPVKSWAMDMPAFQAWQNPLSPTVWAASPASGSFEVDRFEPIHYEVIQETEGIDPDTLGLKINGNPVQIGQVTPVSFGYECTYIPLMGWPSCATISVEACASTASLNPVGWVESWSFNTAGCDLDEGMDALGEDFVAQEKSPAASVSGPKPEPQGPLAALASGFRWLFGADRGASHPSSDSSTKANN